MGHKIHSYNIYNVLTRRQDGGRNGLGGGCRSAVRCAAACLLALTSPAAALAQDDVWGKETSGGGVKEKQINALDYRLQRPRVTKQFDDKRLGSHIFADFGGGANLVGGNGIRPGAQAAFNIGAWITPEHGVRVGATGGVYRFKGINAAFYGGYADYMLNVTALASRHYTGVRPVELYAFAGLDLAGSSRNGKKGKGFGAHIGLRGQARLSRCTYLYLEPRVGIIQDDVPQVYTWHNYRPVASVMAGVGYRMAYGDKRFHFTDSTGLSKTAGEGWMVSVSGGATAMIAGNVSQWKHYLGERVGLSVGKWFGSTNGVRLTGTGVCFKQNGKADVRGLGVSADYMLNLHSLFAGNNPARRYWLNGLVGVSANFTSSYAGTHATFGMGAGLQPNVRISPDVSVFIEPRVDAYRYKYATSRNTTGKWDITGSVLAGLTWTSHPAYLHRAPDGGEEFVQESWHDHMFVEASAGGNIPILHTSVERPLSYVRPTVSIGVGKWFAPLHGMRFWTQMAQTEYDNGHSQRYIHSTIGLDYLFNFSNAIGGYRRYRPLELVGALGVNASVRQRKTGLRWFGMDASFKGIWNLNPFCSLYIEPQLRANGGNFLPSKLHNSKIDFIATVSGGMQFNMNGFNRASASALWNGEEGRRSTFSVAGGVAVQANHPRKSDYYGPVGRLAYTHWYSPLSAWRLSVQGNSYMYKKHRLCAGVVGVDFVTDLTAHTYGYEPSRVVSIMALGGVNLGMDYCRQKTYFAPDFHFGGQFNVRLSDNVHAFLEPQVAYRLSRRFKNPRKSRWLAQALVGLEYSFHRSDKQERAGLTPSRRNFISLAAGAGTYTGTVVTMGPWQRKVTLFTDVDYGRWINGVSGVRFGVGNTVVQRHGRGNENITAVRAGYMMNLRAAVTGENTDDKVFQLTAMLGGTVNVSTRTGKGKRTAVGLDAAMQAGWRVTPAVELFFEPSAALFGKHLLRGGGGKNSHPFEGEVRLSVGTKFCF